MFYNGHKLKFCTDCDNFFFFFFKQRDFTGTMKSLCQKKWDTKLSSAGLVYLHFGRRILQQLLETAEDNPLIEILYDKVYENFIEEIDAIDNGVDQYEGEPR